VTAPTERCRRWWGIGDPNDVFSGGDRTVCPWRSARRLKGQPLVEPDAIASVLSGSPYLADVDPRHLHCTQTWVLQQHVDWYLTGEWERTGTTSADREKAHNRYPLIYEDQWGELVIAAGHHRSMAALIEGRPLRARVLRPAGATAVAVLPNLLLGDAATIAFATANTSEPQSAADLVQASQVAVVTDLATATDALVHLGLAPELVEDRLSMARNGTCWMAA